LQRACQNPGARIKNRENRFLALKMVGIGLIDGVVFADPTGSGSADLARRGTIGRSRWWGAAGNPCAGPGTGVDRTCWARGARAATAIMDRATEAEKKAFI
jgi:hypothetical protein